MRSLILGNQSDSPLVDERAYYEQLRAFFVGVAPSDMTIDYALFGDLLFDIGSDAPRITDTRNDRPLHEYDAVFIRGQFRTRFDIVYVVSTYMRRHNRLVCNDYSHLRTSSKLSQAFVFADMGIPTPRTWCASGSLLVRTSADLQLPFICKDVYGAHGRNNYLVRDSNQLAEIVQAAPQALFVLQEFIPNDGDFRVLYINDKHLIIKRTAAGTSHLNNTSQGGTATLLKEQALPADVIAMGKRCIESLGMTIAGVDIIYDAARGQYIFLEVNAQPQLFTGAFIAEKQRLLGDYLASLS